MRLLLNSEKSGDSVPMYMVGLPEDPFEAELARDKFTKVVSLLQKGYPDMMEAHAIIKSGKTKASKPRYEVQIRVRTPRQQFNYSGVGFSLANVFDEISAWSKRQVTKDDGRKRKERAHTLQFR